MDGELSDTNNELRRVEEFPLKLCLSSTSPVFFSFFFPAIIRQFPTGANSC